MAAATSRQTLARPSGSNKPPPDEDRWKDLNRALRADLRAIIVRFRTCYKRRRTTRTTLPGMARTVTIVDYRETWPADFQGIAAGLRSAYGPTALRIDHIGSTAVPGLAAKDVIDVQVTVPSLHDTPASLPGFVAVPYLADHPPPSFAGEPVDLAKRFFRALPEARPAHVHVRADGRFNQRYSLLCRDYLRAAPAAAAAYAEVKRTLATRFPDDRDAYAELKDPVFDVLMAGAEAWAGATGWTIGPADA
jgi:GrpB-like predicted nucleotidyltransferase (UPF0157 family)